MHFLPQLKKRLDEKQVEMRGDEKACSAAEGLVPATEEDWGREYLDYILSVKTVKNIHEAIAHINRYNTGTFRGNCDEGLRQCAEIPK